MDSDQPIYSIETKKGHKNICLASTRNKVGRSRRNRDGKEITPKLYFGIVSDSKTEIVRSTEGP